MFSTIMLGVVMAQDPNADTPGFGFLGSGYDLLAGNPLATDGLGDPGYRHNIFDWQYSKGATTADAKYKIADKTNSRTFSDCTSTMDETIYNSAYGYKKLISTQFDINLGLTGSGDLKGDSVNFDLGVDVRNTRNHTDTRSRIYAHVSAICTRYQLQMNVFDQANVTRDFARGVAMMPTEFDMDTYARFLTVFGTHYISTMKVGGRWGLQMSFKSDDYQALIDKYVNVHAGIKGTAGVFSGGASINSTQDRKTTYQIAQAVYKNSTFSIGGDFNANPTEWMKSVTMTPMPVHLTLNRLDELFNRFALPDEDPQGLVKKKANLVKSINGWCKYHEALTPGFNCTAQKPIPMPTPSPISENAVRRVCVENDGGFAIQWKMSVSSHPDLGAQTDVYTLGDTECIDGTDINAKHGDVLSCKISLIAGKTIDCEKPQEYSESSTLQANYKCSGIVTTGKCVFNGISKIGATGGGGRRRVFVNLRQALTSQKELEQE